MSSNDANKLEEAEEEAATPPPPSSLTVSERWNLFLLVMAYAAVMSSVTLTVGTGPVIVVSVGGSSEIAPIAIAMFMTGSACISLVTSRLFSTSRKIGFLVGIALGTVGAGVGGIAVWKQSPVLVIFSMLPLGASTGIGMYLRFAAVEIVPASHRAIAVTLVLSGGVAAAFAGPESSRGTKDIFGEDLTFLGTFMMVAIFNVLNAIFVGLTEFPKPPSSPKDGGNNKDTGGQRMLRQVLSSGRRFWVPAVVAACAWSIMAMPMSVARVAMHEVGFTPRQSLWAMEIHFLGMFVPGFVAGTLFTRFGVLNVLALTLLVNASGLATDLAVNTVSVAPWFVGLFLVGVGWNLGFGGGTVMLAQTFTPTNKAIVQAANDFTMFALSGIWIFSTGYIYQAGGAGLDGYRLVNYVAFGLLGVMTCVVGYGYNSRRQEDPQGGDEAKAPTPNPRTLKDEADFTMADNHISDT